MSSMPRLLAASISMISVVAPVLMATQAAQALQGRASGLGSRQLTAFARRRAVVVLPGARGPANS
jgi:hypothetical protein